MAVGEDMRDCCDLYVVPRSMPTAGASSFGDLSFIVLIERRVRGKDEEPAPNDREQSLQGAETRLQTPRAT